MVWLDENSQLPKFTLKRSGELVSVDLTARILMTSASDIFDEYDKDKNGNLGLNELAFVQLCRFQFTC